MAPATRTIVADRGDAGVRLDRVLRRHLGDVDRATRTQVQSWIENGRVTVNGIAVRRTAVRAALGDRVAVVLPDTQPRRTMEAEDAPLAVLYEDDDLLALDKPAGVVVHPAFGHAKGTVMNALLGRARTWSAGRRPSIVGRLDKGTSGIVLVAKTAAVHAALQRGMARADKQYLAIVYGRTPHKGTIDLRLYLYPHDRRRVVVAAADAGLESRTSFERLARVAAPRAGLTLLRCRLHTGRRHQIRVHLAARGWPIVGDPKYGEPRWTRIDDPAIAGVLQAMTRQALHAWRLAFTHPSTGRPVQVEAPVPRDLAEVLARTGLILRP